MQRGLNRSIRRLIKPIKSYAGKRYCQGGKLQVRSHQHLLGISALIQHLRTCPVPEGIFGWWVVSCNPVAYLVPDSTRRMAPIANSPGRVGYDHLLEPDPATDKTLTFRKFKFKFLKLKRTEVKIDWIIIK